MNEIIKKLVARFNADGHYDLAVAILDLDMLIQEYARYDKPMTEHGLELKHDLQNLLKYWTQ